MNSNPMQPDRCRAWSTVTFPDLDAFWAALEKLYADGQAFIGNPQSLEVQHLE